MQTTAQEESQGTAVHRVLQATGGIVPAIRRRSSRVLNLVEREEISRGIAAGCTIRAIARVLNRAPSTISQEVSRHGGRKRYRAAEAIDFAYVLQQSGDTERALALLDGSERAISGLPRMGSYGYAYADVQIHALRGNKPAALAALREAVDAGWRSWWHYFRDFDPALDPIRNEPAFKAIFADIERDMARQRAALAARPKDAPLDLTASPQ